MPDESLPLVPEDARFDYGGMCWWCGAQADSREHKFKRTDVVRAFGPPPWTDTVVHVKDGKERIVQGPNSSLLKFQDSLCAVCNNDRSQTMDQTYDVLMQFLEDNRARIARGESIDQTEIYGSDWTEGRDQALRFIVKLIGCRLSESGVQVPKGLVDFLDGSAGEPAGLNVELCFNLVVQELERHLDSVHGLPPDGSLWLGNCVAEYEPISQVVSNVQSHIGIESFWYVYDISCSAAEYRSNMMDRVLMIPHLQALPPGSVGSICETCTAQSD